MLDKEHAQGDKSRVYSRLAGTSSGLLPSPQQQTRHQRRDTTAASYTSQLQKKRLASADSTPAGRFSLRAGSQQHINSAQHASRLTGQGQQQQQQQQQQQLSRGRTSPTAGSPPCSPVRFPAQQHASSSPTRPAPAAMAPGSPATPSAAAAATSPRAAAAAAAPGRTGSPKHSHQQAPAYAPEELLRAARCQDPVSTGHSACSSPARHAPAAPAEEQLHAATAARQQGQQLLLPRQQPATGLDRQQADRQQQQQQRGTQRQPQQPRPTGALPQPLTQHGQATGGLQQQPDHQQQHQMSPQRGGAQLHILQQALQQQQQQEQQQQQQHASAGSAPEAEASFGYLTAEPGSSTGSPPTAADASTSRAAMELASAAALNSCSAGLQGEGSQLQGGCAQQTDSASGLQQEQQTEQQQQVQQHTWQPAAAQQPHADVAPSTADVVQQHAVPQEQPLAPPSHLTAEQQEQPHVPQHPGDDVSKPRDVSPEKQQQLLARLCAKHGLPLPHPRHLGKQQQQQRGSGLWGPSRQQGQAGRVTQQGGQVARRREDLLQQLKDSSVSRRKPTGPGAASGTTSGQGQQQGPGESSAQQQEGEQHQQRQQQQQQLVVVGPCLSPPSPAASELHLVGGLQYVHALLGSIKMPSASASAAGAATASIDSRPGSICADAALPLPPPQQQRQRQLVLPSATSGAVQDSLWGCQPQEGQEGAAVSPRRQQWGHAGTTAEACAGDLQALCASALAKLQAAAGRRPDAADEAGAGGHGVSLLPQQYPTLPLQDALVLLCMLDGSIGQHQHQQQQCFAALHAAAQQHMRAPAGDPLHQQPQPGWHRQQQQRLAQGLCWGPRQLGMRAAAAVAASREAWMCEQEVAPLWGCLRQVQQQLWRQQALAEAGSGGSGLPGSPTKAAAAAAHKGSGSPAAPRSPRKGVGTATAAATAATGRDRTPPCSRAGARCAQGLQGSSSTSPRKQPLSATIVAKRLTVGAVLRGTADLGATCAGWEGTPVLIKLLTDLRNKLLCKLALRAMRVGAAAASQRELLLSVQLPAALGALQLSAAFGAWRAWAADRGATRGHRQDLRVKVRTHQAGAALRAWAEAASCSSWLKACHAALTQRRQRLLTVRAFHAWRCARAQQQVDLAQHALAVLWHARVTVARVLLAWAREARQAVLLATMVWDDASESCEPSSAGTSSSPSRRQSSCTDSQAQAQGVGPCSRDLAAVLALQWPWRERVLAAVAEAHARCEAAFAEADRAVGEARGRMLPLLAAAQLLLQTWQAERQLKVQQQQQEWQLGSGHANRQEQQQQRQGVVDERRRPRVEWSAQLLADDSSSYMLPHSNLSSRRVSAYADDDGDPCCMAAVSGHGGLPAASWPGAAAAAQAGREMGPSVAVAAAGLSAGHAAVQASQQQQWQQQQQYLGYAHLAGLDPGAAGGSPASALQAAAAGMAAATGALQPGVAGAPAAGVSPAGSSPTATTHAGHTLAGAASVPTAGSAAGPQHQCGVQDSCSWPAAGSPLRQPAAAAAVGGGAVAASPQLLAVDGSPSRRQELIASSAAAAAAAGGGGGGAVQSSASCLPAIAAGGYRCGSDSPGVVTSRPQSRLSNTNPAAAGAAAGQPRAADAGAAMPTVPAAAAAAADLGGGGIVGLAVRLHQLLAGQVPADAVPGDAATGVAGPVNDKGPACNPSTAAAAAAASSSSVMARDGALSSSSGGSDCCDPGAVAAAVATLRAVSVGDMEQQSPLRQLLPGREVAALAAAATEAAGTAQDGLRAATAAGPLLQRQQSPPRQLPAAGGAGLLGNAAAAAGPTDVGAWMAAAAETLAPAQQQQQQGQQPECHLPPFVAVAQGVPGRPPQQQQHQQEELVAGGHCASEPAAAAALAAPGAANSSGSEHQLLQHSLRHWLRLVRGRSLLVRVFAGAEAAWQARTRQEVAEVLDAGCGPHVQDFRLMRRVFEAWGAHTAQQLQGAAALAAVEAAAAYHSSRLTVRAWKAWRVFLAQAPAVQQRYSSALASLCLLGWHQHTLQQRSDPHSRARQRQQLRARSGGWCGSEQQWRQVAVTQRAFARWRGLVGRGALHYRLRLLASAMTSWQLAVEDTQHLLLPFHHRWQRQRLLQRALLLWHSLVLLMRQQRQEAAAAEAWRDSRLASAALAAWADWAAAQGAHKAAVAAAVGSYERKLLRRQLLQWSLVVCASSAARVYYQHGLLQRVLRGWRAEIAAHALRCELTQQQAVAAPAAAGALLQQQMLGLHPLLPPELLPLQQQRRRLQQEWLEYTTHHSPAAAGVSGGGGSWQGGQADTVPIRHSRPGAVDATQGAASGTAAAAAPGGNTWAGHELMSGSAASLQDKLPPWMAAPAAAVRTGGRSLVATAGAGSPQRDSSGSNSGGQQRLLLQPPSPPSGHAVASRRGVGGTGGHSAGGARAHGMHTASPGRLAAARAGAAAGGVKGTTSTPQSASAAGVGNRAGGALGSSSSGGIVGQRVTQAGTGRDKAAAAKRRRGAAAVTSAGAAGDSPASVGSCSPAKLYPAVVQRTVIQ